MRAGGDVIRGRTFAVARLWHDASALTRRAGGGGSAISLVVEGRIRVTRGATSIEVGKGEGFIDTLDGATTVEVENSVGSIELRVSESFSRRYGVSVADGLHWLGPDLDSLPWLLSRQCDPRLLRGAPRDDLGVHPRGAREPGRGGAGRGERAAVRLDRGSRAGGDPPLLHRPLLRCRSPRGNPADDAALASSCLRRAGAHSAPGHSPRADPRRAPNPRGAPGSRE